MAAEEDTSCAWSYRRGWWQQSMRWWGRQNQKSKHCEVMDDKDKWYFHDLMRQGNTAFQVDLSYWTGYWRDGVQGRAGEGQLVR